jgi:hypothetical protein
MVMPAGAHMCRPLNAAVADAAAAPRATPSVQGLTLVHFPAQRKHIL